MIVIKMRTLGDKIIMAKFFASGTVTFDFVVKMESGALEEFMMLVQEKFGEQVIIGELEAKYTKEITVHNVEVEWMEFEKEEE